MLLSRSDLHVFQTVRQYRAAALSDGKRDTETERQRESTRRGEGRENSSTAPITGRVSIRVGGMVGAWPAGGGRVAAVRLPRRPEAVRVSVTLLGVSSSLGVASSHDAARTFTVTLPLVDAALAAAPRDDSLRHPSTSTTSDTSESNGDHSATLVDAARGCQYVFVFFLLFIIVIKIIIFFKKN